MPRRQQESPVYWITNAAAPYRVPVWEALGKDVDLEVYVLESDRRLRRDATRGQEWELGEIKTERFRLLRAKSLRVRRGETLLYLGFTGIYPLKARSFVIGGWESPAYWQVLLWGKLRRAWVVGFYESTIKSTRHRRGPIAAARRVFFHLCDAIVVPGVASAEAITSMGIDASKVYVGFNAVDVTRFWETRQRAKAQPQIAGHRFLFIGQLIERKNVDSAIRAFARIMNPADSFTIVGDGTLRPQLERLRSELGMDSSINFKGAVPYENLPQEIAGYDTLVLPSVQEVWGLVVNEALASGCHAVVSVSTGVARSVEGMQGVFVVEPSVDGIANGFRRSRSEWTSPIERPSILRYGPSALSDTFATALKARP